MQHFSELLLAAGNEHDAWSLIAAASPVVKGVMGLLALMFLACLYIIIFKGLFIARASRESKQFNTAFWQSRDIEQIYKVAQSMHNSPVAAMFLAGYTELAKLTSDESSRASDGDLDNVVRALRKAQTEETTRLESMTPFLACTWEGPTSLGWKTPSPPPSIMAGPPIPSELFSVAMMTSAQPARAALPAKQYPETILTSGIWPLSLA